MSASKIKKGDNVVILSGKDKGRTGTVAQVMPKDGKVIVEGVNIAARHRKPSQANPQGDDLVRWRYQRYMHDYLGCVKAVDESVGRVLQYLDDEGLAIDLHRAHRGPRQWSLAAAMVAKFVATTCATAIRESASSA